MRKQSDFRKIRDISDLRIQYFCEYRLLLSKKYGDSSSLASVRGEWLHSKIGVGGSAGLMEQNSSMVVFFVITILVLLLLFLIGD